MSGHLFPLNTSLRPFLVKPLRACVYQSIKCYTQASKNNDPRDFIKERAPSTAEEFKKIAEEKLREAQQGVASQVAEKVYDGTEEATLGDKNQESVKNRYKEHERGADYRKRGDGPDGGVTAFSSKA
ncbi:uncharacterized protein LOC126689072 isoform X2 [Quercus robur]|uniref:uncharacterized protein LOC126689072 isoform X2 n=1 Tax=Quercus robur TaxID=38942 RepID=UPI002162D7D8|nr:uncharacterized protein LOC126689072 isoform X2 [Quercus robur]